MTFRVAAALLLAVCAGCTAPRRDTPRPEPGLSSAPVSYSGMALIEPDRYLVVHDAKGREQQPRLGIISIMASRGAVYATLEISDWKSPDGPGNDLESACSLSDHPREFLIAESGYWETKYGRVFHIRVSGATAEVVRTYKLPLIADNTRAKAGDNFEGLACIKQADGRYLLVLGERGGSDLYPSGLLRWGWFDPPTATIAWAESGQASLPVTAPGPWPAGTNKRDIADLYVDPHGVLWAVATADHGDNGPFRSVIFRLGTVTPGRAAPVQVDSSPIAGWIIDGVKVEALAAPARAVPGSVLAVGTDDENLGGVWRAVFPPVTPLP